MIHTFSIAFSDDVTTTPTTYSATQTGDGQTNLDVLAASGVTNFNIACTMDVSEVKSVLINSDVTATGVFKSGSNVVQTMLFTANKPLLWQSAFPQSNPITGDFTSITISGTRYEDLSFKAYFLQDV